MNIGKSILILGATVLLFDTVTAFFSLKYSVSYTKFAFGSWLIYVMSGFVVKQAKWFWKSIVTGAAIAGLDATLGWLISWQLGPGRIPERLITTDTQKYGTIFIIIIVVTLQGTVLGLAGGAIKKIQMCLTTKNV
jgi:hypothetical protein